MKGIIHSLALYVLGLVCVVNAWAIPEPEHAGLYKAREARAAYNPPPVSTSTTSTTTTTTSTTSTTGTETDTLTTTAYYTPHCSGTITYVTTIVLPGNTYTVGTTFFYEKHSYMYYVSGTSTYSTTEAVYTSETYVPGKPGPGPKTATAPTTARQINTLPSPCVAVILTKTITFEPEVQTQVYLKNSVSAFFAWTATTGTKTLEKLATVSTEVTVDVYTGTTKTLPYTQPSLATLHLNDPPPPDNTTVVVSVPTGTEAAVAASTAAPVATGAAVSQAVGGVGMLVAAVVVGVLGL